MMTIGSDSRVTRVDFYQLHKWPIENVLPSLLEKVYKSEMRAVLLAGSRARVESLDILLWTYSPDSWLPHGCEGDAYAEHQIIWLTTKDENPNNADVLVLIDNMDSINKAKYLRCLDLFDGDDPHAVSSARHRWLACCNAGFQVFCWKQTEHSKWEQKSGII